VKFAVLTRDPEVAFFRARQAEMYARFHKRVSKIKQFVPLGELAAARLADGTLVFCGSPGLDADDGELRPRGQPERDGYTRDQGETALGRGQRKSIGRRSARTARMEDPRGSGGRLIDWLW
jgi:hypothetical protein